MTQSKLGVYWSVMHRRQQDYDYFKRLQPAVFKIMDGGPPDYQFAKDNLPNSLVIARDWALSEQHSDMLRDPVGTGQRHATEWNQHQSRLGFDRAKTLILGINEPQVWNPGVPEALRLYTIALCDKATELGLRVGAMQFSVGWPGNKGADTPPDWLPWHGVEAAIQRNSGALICHEYWADSGPFENWGWWGGRSLKCPWQVPIIIGEDGVDMYVKDGSVEHAKRGWRGRMSPERYAQEKVDYVARMAQDPRFVGDAGFASDFASHEWFSFDIEPAYQAILALPQPQAAPQPSTPAQPVIVPSNLHDLTHPIQNPALRIISQFFGDNPQDYARFGLKGHNGLDFAVPIGTPIRAVDDGEVIESQVDEDGYGSYVKLRHSWGESLYAHLSLAQPMTRSPKGAIIGLSGNTGNSTGPHLHFGMRVNPYTRGGSFDGYSDPEKYLDKVATPTQPTTDVLSAIKDAAQDFGIEWQLLASLAWAESSFNPKAVSSVGAKGLTQLMPDTWGDWALAIGASDPFDTRDNLRVGAAYLAYLLKTLGNEWSALCAYNFGIGNVLNKVKPPLETTEFANKVIHGRDLLKAIGRTFAPHG